MTLHSLPIFVRLAGQPVILLGSGEAADAKRRLLQRAGATIVGEDSDARLAIVVDDEFAVARLKARGVLINAVDRPELCDFTLPAIVERGDVIVAVGTGGVSAGLAAALRQRIEAWLPASVGALASALQAAREAMRERWPDGADRRRVLGAALSPGSALDPLGARADVTAWLASDVDVTPQLTNISLGSNSPDDLTLTQARALALADRIYHDPAVPTAILDRARADAERIAGPAPAALPRGNNVRLDMSE